jgi:hypothetical protein
MEFEPEEDRIQVSFQLNADQIRFILSYAEGRLRGAGTAKRPRQTSPRKQPTPVKPTPATAPPQTKKGP